MLTKRTLLYLALITLLTVPMLVHDATTVKAVQIGKIFSTDGRGIRAPLTTDTLQTIPPIVVSGPNAVSGCTVLNLSPGSAIIGQSDWILSSCPNNAPAIILRGTETPTFILSTGFTQLTIMFAGYPCNSPFLAPFGGRLIGASLLSSGPITFTAMSNSTTQLMAGPYNYCLFYSNPPAGGILSFTIAWSP